jgi:hypothetical protein
METTEGSIMARGEFCSVPLETGPSNGRYCSKLEQSPLVLWRTKQITAYMAGRGGGSSVPNDVLHSLSR